MRSEGAIRQKLKQAQYRHVKKALVDSFPSGEDWPKNEVESIKAEYRDFFASSPIHIIAKDFPDVAALMWVLEDQPDDGFVVDGSLVGKMGGVMLWADSEEEASKARSMIDRIVEEATREPDPPSPDTSVVPVMVEETALEPVRKSWWKRIFG